MSIALGPATGSVTPRTEIAGTAEIAATPATVALDATVVRIDATRATVALVGELDLATAPIARALLDHQLAQGCLHVRLDLAGLQFLDCAGLAVLLHADERLRAAQGSLVLTGAGARITRLLAITRLDAVLRVADAS